MPRLLLPRGGPVAPFAPNVLRELTDLFKSLADETRLKILALLAANGEMNVTAIGEALGHSQPAVSHHLMQLRIVGLIDFRRDGKFNRYSLNPTGLHDLFAKLSPDGNTAKLLIGGVEVNLKQK